MSAPTLATIKKLFAVSGNKCAFPGCSFPLVKEISGRVIGHVCHIKAKNPGGPRYDSGQNEKERHGFENLVLMCPNHHEVIDIDTEIYTVEALLEIKSQHESQHASGAELTGDLARQFLRLEVRIAGDLVQGGDKVDSKIVYEARRAAVRSLHQLPPPPADFTGREKELAELRKAIQQGGVTVFGVRGMGGIGKTALALQLAAQITPHCPDAQLYLDLKGTDPTPLTVVEAMAHMVRAYHPTAPLPESKTDLEALYRSVLHGQRALLLLDNVASADQVKPLIPPHPCVLLVTSRSRFTLPGMRTMNLDMLLPKDARALLLHIADRIGDYADEMARLCGYLPLALRLAGSALAEREDLHPSDYLRRLDDKRTRLHRVDASLGLSYSLLCEKMQCQWAMLAVFPGTFDRRAAAAVWKIELDVAQDTLSELLRLSLVEWNAEADRYHLHDLARLFGESHLGKDDRLMGKQRYAEHYFNVAQEARELLGTRQEAEGLARCDLEQLNLKHAHLFLSRSRSRDQLELMCQLQAELCEYYDRSGYWEERRSMLERAVQALNEPGSDLEHDLGEIEIQLADVYRRQLWDLDTALKYYLDGLNRIDLERLSSRFSSDELYRKLGDIYRVRGEFREALAQYAKAEELLPKRVF